MRPIEFRGKSKKTGEWLYGSLINNAFVRSATGENILYIFDENIDADYDSFEDIVNILDDFGEVIPETVGQFTGLCDKNNTRIYKGDVVKWQGWEVSRGRQKRPDRFMAVGDGYITNSQSGDPLPQGNWIDDCFHLQNIMSDGSPVEVIGNIHENPELYRKGE